MRTILCLCVLLSACATAGKYRTLLDSWVGAPEINLVRSWGPPQQAYQSGDRKFLVYSRQANMVLPGAAPTYQTRVIGNTAYTNQYGGYPAQNVPLSCVTTFEVHEERIVSWQTQGNHCVAR